MLKNYTTEEKLKCFEAMINNIENHVLNYSPEEDNIELTIRASKLKSTDKYAVINMGNDFDILNKMMYDIRDELVGK